MGHAQKIDQQPFAVRGRPPVERQERHDCAELTCVQRVEDGGGGEGVAVDDPRARMTRTPQRAELGVEFDQDEALRRDTARNEGRGDGTGAGA